MQNCPHQKIVLLFLQHKSFSCHIESFPQGKECYSMFAKMMTEMWYLNLYIELVKIDLQSSYEFIHLCLSSVYCVHLLFIKS